MPRDDTRQEIWELLQDLFLPDSREAAIARVDRYYQALDAEGREAFINILIEEYVDERWARMCRRTLGEVTVHRL